MEKLTLQPNKEDAGQRVDAWLAARVEGLTRSAAAGCWRRAGWPAAGKRWPKTTG